MVDSSERLRVITDKNVDNTCNVKRKPGGKNANVSPNRGQQDSVTAQENLKLAVFLFHHHSSDDSLFEDEKPKAHNKNNPALDRKGSRTIHSNADI